MIKALENHFINHNDFKYISLKNKIKDIINDVSFSNRDNIEAIEECAAITEYLIIYNKNIIRMADKPNINTAKKELDFLYLYEKKIDLLKKNFFIKNNIFSKKYRLCGQEFMLHEKLIEKDNDVKNALVKYQEIIDNICDENNVNVNSLYNKYLSSNDYLYRIELANQINNIIEKKYIELESLYIKIKKYQLNKSKINGYVNPLQYIAKTYNVSEKYIDMVNEITSKYKYPTVYNIENDTKITFQEACSFLIEIFEKLSKKFSEMIKIAIKDNWIDYEKRNGKLEGYYTNIISYCRKSIISANYDGTLKSVCKIAHEIGHAYHGYLISENSFYATDYSVIIAETFGLFCEKYCMKMIIKEHKRFGFDYETLKKYFDNSINLIYANNILAYKFENASFDCINNKKLEFTEVYKRISKEILYKKDDIIPYEWILRSQNFFPDNYYYNFVYILGFIFSEHIEQKLKKKELNFEQIEDLLTKSGMYTVDELIDSIKLFNNINN